MDNKERGRLDDVIKPGQNLSLKHCKKVNIN